MGCHPEPGKGLLVQLFSYTHMKASMCSVPDFRGLPLSFNYTLNNSIKVFLLLAVAASVKGHKIPPREWESVLLSRCCAVSAMPMAVSPPRAEDRYVNLTVVTLLSLEKSQWQ